MKNLPTFNEFVNEEHQYNMISENLNSYGEIIEYVEDVFKQMGKRIASTEKTKYAVKPLTDMLLTSTEDLAIVSFNEKEMGSCPTPIGSELPDIRITGIITKGDTKYAVTSLKGAKYSGNALYNEQQLGLVANFASGRTKALTPVQNSLWNNTLLNKQKGTINYIIRFK